MNPLKILSRKHLITISGMLFIIIVTLVVWGHHEKTSFISTYKQEYMKVKKENDELKLEIENLKEQNLLLNRVLELKQDIK